MRRFIVHVLVMTFALSVTLGLLSLILVPVGDPDGVPLLRITGTGSIDLELFIDFPDVQIGFLFAVIYAALPLTLAVFFGRWYLRYPLIAFLAVNAAVFFAVATISGLLGRHFVVPEPPALWLLVDSVVFALVAGSIGAFLGFDRPSIHDGEASPWLWSLLERLPPARRNTVIENIRLHEVYETVSSFGMDIALARLPFPRLRRVGDRLAGRTSVSIDKLSAPAKVRVMLQQLGPTYVKLGQMIGSRREVLPREWYTELEKLQSSVPPVPWDAAASVISSELGHSPEELFATIEREPLGAASLAQVHRATLLDGSPVVVKVQRPRVQAKVRADLGVMQYLAQVAEEKFAAARRFGAVGIVEEFANGVLEELDYSIEAYNARRLASVLAPIEGVGVPKVFDRLCTKRVLVMDFVGGVKATHADQLDPSIDRSAVGRRLVRALIKQVLVDGFFHADPHPGNVMLDPATGDITFLDLGLVGELRQQQRFDVLALVWALKSQDPDLLASVVRRLCIATGPVDDGAFHAAVERILYRTWVFGHGSFGDVMGSLFDTLADHDLRMRRELTMAIKTVMQAEELVTAIAPGLPLIDVVVEEAVGLIRAQSAAELDTLLQGDLGGAVRKVLEAAPTVGRALIPRLLQAARVVGVIPSPPPPGPDLGPLTERVDGLSERLDRQVGRLAFAAGLGGLGLVAALTTLAFYLRPTSALTGLDLLVLAPPLAVGLSLVVLLRAWRGQDDAARSRKRRGAG